MGENILIKKEIINKLKETIGQADYYDLFENVLDTINKMVEEITINDIIRCKLLF